MQLPAYVANVTIVHLKFKLSFTFHRLLTVKLNELQSLTANTQPSEPSLKVVFLSVAPHPLVFSWSRIGHSGSRVFFSAFDSDPCMAAVGCRAPALRLNCKAAVSVEHSSKNSTARISKRDHYMAAMQASTQLLGGTQDSFVSTTWQCRHQTI